MSTTNEAPQRHNPSAMGSALIYERTLFVFTKDGMVTLLSLDQTTEFKLLDAGGWKHTATIDPALWIKALIESEPACQRDMMDELVPREGVVRREAGTQPIIAKRRRK